MQTGDFRGRQPGHPPRHGRGGGGGRGGRGGGRGRGGSNTSGRGGGRGGRGGRGANNPGGGAGGPESNYAKVMNADRVLGIFCQVCNETGEANEAKYKCPLCRTPYCSLTCYKKHKAEAATKCEPFLVGDQAVGSASKAAASKACAVSSVPSSALSEVTKYGDYKQSEESTVLERAHKAHELAKRRAEEESSSKSDNAKYQLTPDNLQALDASAYLQQELKDGGLRNLILSVDMAEDPLKALRQAMTGYKHGPAFSAFCDKMLAEASIVVQKADQSHGLLNEFVGLTSKITSKSIAKKLNSSKS